LRTSKRVKLQIELQIETRKSERSRQLLFEEGCAYFWALDFKLRDIGRGVSMIQESASAGFPMALAVCHFYGWNGFKRDLNMARHMCAIIEETTDGYHWAQFMLGKCFVRNIIVQSYNTEIWYNVPLVSYTVNPYYPSGVNAKATVITCSNIIPPNIQIRITKSVEVTSAGIGYAAGEKLCMLMVDQNTLNEDLRSSEIKYSTWCDIMCLNGAYKEDKTLVDNDLNGTSLVTTTHKDQNYTKAVEWFTKSSAQGNSAAMTDLGFRYEQGEGCDQNINKAVELYEKGAQLGSSAAMLYLANCYKDGTGATKDINKAVDWYTKASVQGNRFAMSNLGVCYENGDGVTKDFNQARELYTRANAQYYCWNSGASRQLVLMERADRSEQEKIKQHIRRMAEIDRMERKQESRETDRKSNEDRPTYRLEHRCKKGDVYDGTNELKRIHKERQERIRKYLNAPEERRRLSVTEYRLSLNSINQLCNAWVDRVFVPCITHEYRHRDPSMHYLSRQWSHRWRDNFFCTNCPHTFNGSDLTSDEKKTADEKKKDEENRKKKDEENRKQEREAYYKMKKQSTGECLRWNCLNARYCMCDEKKKDEENRKQGREAYRMKKQSSGSHECLRALP
jgi:TPR repeat protein